MTFQTKKQLREETARQVRRAIHAEKDLADLEAAVKGEGWEPQYDPGQIFISRDFLTGERTDPIIGWNAPDRKAAAEQAEAETRRETLETVIQALELREYGYHGAGEYCYGGYTGVDKRPGHERLWDDLQTALKVRAERKTQDEADATEKKVAGLTKKAEASRYFVFSHDESYAHAQTIPEGDTVSTPRKSGKNTAIKNAKKETKK